MDYINSLSQCVFAEDEVKDTEAKLKESAERQDVKPLSETYIDARINEQQKAEEFAKKRMEALGMNPANADNASDEASETVIGAPVK
jgi:uncharacterized protein involved in type VI secretion and phage assembly